MCCGALQAPGSVLIFLTRSIHTVVIMFDENRAVLVSRDWLLVSTCWGFCCCAADHTNFPSTKSQPTHTQGTPSPSNTNQKNLSPHGETKQKISLKRLERPLGHRLRDLLNVHTPSSLISHRHHHRHHHHHHHHHHHLAACCVLLTLPAGRTFPERP